MLVKLGAKMLEATIFWSIAVIIIVLGVVFPTVKRRKCTEYVNATLSPKAMKERGASFDASLETRYFSGKGTYFFKGDKYTVTVKAEQRCTYVRLRINPNNPKQFVYASPKNYLFCVIVCGIFAVALIIVGILFLD